ncbi:MAG TPA: hypothetical protein DDY13_16395 [Cytophagales bacterium]|jgi:hypothetical protein|nr:hypothetical protein [Cytophagales bacterium]
MEMGNIRIPKRLALLLARVVESIWEAFDLAGNPPITYMIAHLMGTDFIIVAAIFGYVLLALQ